MGYNKILWGFVLMFDFRLGGFDILPDILGYYFMYQGLKTIKDKNEYNSKALNYVIPMMFLSLFSLYQSPTNEFIRSSSPIGLLLGGIVMVINLILVYNICYGIREEAVKLDLVGLSKAAESRWMLYLIVNVSLIVLMVLPIFFLGIILFVASIISYFLMIGLMNQAKNNLLNEILYEND